MNIRHGDLALISIKKVPEGLKETKTKIIMQGSGGNNHSFDNGKLYFRKINQFVFGYFEAKDTTLLHIEHGEKKENKKLREAQIPDGIYELRKQCEFINYEIKPVID